MKKIAEICGLLQKKREAFLEYERASEQLVSCEHELMEEYMRRREELMQVIDLLDEQITQVDGPESEMAQIAHCRGSRSDLPAVWLVIYDAAQSVFAIAHRIRRLDAQALRRLETERACLEEKIRQTNRSTAAQASKYASAGSQDQVFGGIHIGRA